MPETAQRRALLVNLDFRDFVYSHLWGRAVVDGCTRRNTAADGEASKYAGHARRHVALPATRYPRPAEDPPAVGVSAQPLVTRASPSDRK